MQQVAVIFRRWRDTGDVIALFPELPSDINGHYCDSYEHVGQHGGADYFGVIRQTVPAAPGECADLSVELKRIGYRLKPLMRASWRQHERRREAARAFREADTDCGGGTTSPTSPEGDP
jgi:hypothetical protein